jgi:endoglucanase
LFIDIGADSLEEAKKMGVRIVDSVEFDVKFTAINRDVVIGKAMDDRVGCAVVIEVLKRLQKTECTVYTVGTVQEEVGARGATTAAFGIYPDVGFALDVTVAGDMPGVKENEAPTKLKKGPALTVSDGMHISHPKVLRLLTEVADENKIPYQLETGMGGGTDAGRISLVKEGVPSLSICIPTRYIHSPTSLLNLTDMESTVKLTVAAIKKIPKYF